MDIAVSGIILQLGEDENPKVLAKVSRLLKNNERNYVTFEREFLAMKKNAYLLVDIKLILRTDNRALKYLFGIEKCVSQRVARWQAYLSMFDISSIEHKPGKENTGADALNRFKTYITTRLNYFSALPGVMCVEASCRLTTDDVYQNLKAMQDKCLEIKDTMAKQPQKVLNQNGIIY